MTLVPSRFHPTAARGRIRDRNRTFHWKFACDPASAGASRQAVDSLEAHLHRALLDDVRLLVSELVTNSVRHGPDASGRPIGLTLSVSPEMIHAEVRDRGHGFDPVAIPTTDDESGRGLFMVRELADRWGMAAQPGTRVWFEILL